MVAKFTREHLEPLFDAALSQEFGIAIQTNDKRHLVNKLHEVRKDIGNPEHEALMVCSPNTDEVFLVKKATEL